MRETSVRGRSRSLESISSQEARGKPVEIVKTIFGERRPSEQSDGSAIRRQTFRAKGARSPKKGFRNRALALVGESRRTQSSGAGRNRKCATSSTKVRRHDDSSRVEHGIDTRVPVERHGTSEVGPDRERLLQPAKARGVGIERVTPPGHAIATTHS